MIMAASVGVALLAGLAVFQVLLAAGAPLGRFAWGGRHDVLPAGQRVGSAVSVAVYAVVAVVLLARADVLDVLPDGPVHVLTWVLTGYLALATAMNAMSRSRPERLVMTPVALALAVACLLLALG